MRVIVICSLIPIYCLPNVHVRLTSFFSYNFAKNTVLWEANPDVSIAITTDQPTNQPTTHPSCRHALQLSTHSVTLPERSKLLATSSFSWLNVETRSIRSLENFKLYSHFCFKIVTFCKKKGRGDKRRVFYHLIAANKVRESRRVVLCLGFYLWFAGVQPCHHVWTSASSNHVGSPDADGPRIGV